MKKAILLIITFTFAVIIVDAQSAKHLPKAYTSAQLRKTITINPAGFNMNDSKILVSSNESGIFNVCEINVADKKSVSLTNSKEDGMYAVDYLKGSNKFIYAADKGGNEDQHLYITQKGNTEIKDITPWPKSKNQFFGWSKDDKSIYITSNKRDARFFDVLKLDTATWTETMLYKNDSAYTPSAISKNEKLITLSKEITTDKNELYLFNIETKSTTRLSNSNEATWTAMAFGNKDNLLYYTSNDGSEFQYLIQYTIATKEKVKLFQPKWDITDLTLSKNDTYGTVTMNEDGKNKVLLFSMNKFKPVLFPDLGDADVMSVKIADNENNLLLTVGSSTSSPNLYVYNIGNKKLLKLTSTLNPEINEADLVKAEVVRIKSFDGLAIPCIYYKPLQANKNNKVGALVWVHGGPGGQSRVGFSNSIQYLVNHGYAVLAINNRGSSGYGKTFFKLDNKDHGYGDLKDCLWAKKWLSQQNYIDSNAIGIEGGSYGGNMVLNAMCMHPNEFKAGVDLFGVANWIRTLKSIPPYWESFRKALYVEMGDPATSDSVLLKKTSPLFNYQSINKPLIVFQGENDVRVLKVESDEIVAGVKKNGVPVEYIVYPGEGHGFTKKENLITTDEKTLTFLEKYLRPVSK